MSEPYKGLNAALARNSGPSAEDVEALADVMRRADDEALVRTNFGQLVADYDETARAVLASDWLTAHTAAAEARGAERGARAVVEALDSHTLNFQTERCSCGLLVWTDGQFHKHRIAAAREAAARVEGGA